MNKSLKNAEDYVKKKTTTVIIPLLIDKCKTAQAVCSFQPDAGRSEYLKGLRWLALQRQAKCVCYHTVVFLCFTYVRVLVQLQVSPNL